MKRVLVTGSEGQLGKCLQIIAATSNLVKFKFMDAKGLDITNVENINSVLESGAYDYCINCAAYTNVEEAEKNPDEAFAINANGVKILSKCCQKYNIILIHISTDYVFDGEKKEGYLTTDIPNPINQYGKSKLAGEEFISEILEKHFIIRTSWLYSEFGHNFYKTILKKAQTDNVLYVTDEQTGCPTNANNLAKYIFNLIVSHSTDYGLHHFTDGKAMTWYDFAKEILRETNLDRKVRVEKAGNYRTFAARPLNSVLKSG